MAPRQWVRDPEMDVAAIMNFVQKIRLERLVQRLKDTHELSRSELASVQEQLVAAGSEAIEPVLRCLGHISDRRPALAVLTQLLTDDTLGLFVQALASSDPDVAAGATQALAAGRRYRVGALLPFLADASIPKAALERVLSARATALLAREIHAALVDLDKDGRTLLLRVLEKSMTGDFACRLTPLLGHGEMWVRHRAVELLGRFNEPRVIEALIRALPDENHAVRRAAVEALHALRARAAIPALVARLRDPDLKVQSAAIDTLTDFNDVAAVPHLLQVLTDESEQARRCAVEVLNAVATTEAIQDLLRALHDADWWVRVRAADALSWLGGEKVVIAAVGLLADPEEFIRRYAVEMLNSIPHVRAVPSLIDSLKDADWWVRERSIDALGKIKDARAVEPLLELMQRVPETAALCARALGAIGDPRAIEPLGRLVLSDRSAVRREAVAALRALDEGPRTKQESTALQAALAQAAQAQGEHAAAQAHSAHAQAGHVSAGHAQPGHAHPALDAEAIERVPLRVEAHVRGTSGGAHSSGGRLGPSTSLGGAAGTPERAAINLANLSEGTRLLDRYRVMRRVGSGGFGTVYLVMDGAVQEEVILKVLNPMLSVDENAIRRFVQELKLTRRITHRNVIRIFDFLDLGTGHAVSMEYFPSRDVRHILAADGAQSPARTLRLVEQVCQGLAAAHDEGVIHRDIKPANVLVGHDDTAKIVDFGLAAVQHGKSTLTRSSVIIGTPEYMAPELIQGERMDHRVDIYSLGILMYEMLSGRRPFTAETPVKVLFQHLEGKAQPLLELVPTLPKTLAALVARCMARDAGQRPQDVRELLGALEAESHRLNLKREGA